VRSEQYNSSYTHDNGPVLVYGAEDARCDQNSSSEEAVPSQISQHDLLQTSSELRGRKRRMSQVDDGHKTTKRSNTGFPSNPATPCTSTSSTSVLHFHFSQLLDFLQQHQGDPDIRMICPYDGVPRPYSELNLDTDAGIAIKMEFSFLTSKALIQYLQSSESANTEASHRRTA